MSFGLVSDAEEKLTCAWVLNDTHSTPSLVINLLASPGTTADPRLSDVHARRIRHLDPLAVLGLNLARLIQRLAVRLAETHTALCDGEISRLLEVILDFRGHLLLGPLHLRNGVVDILASDLARQHDQLLDASGQEVTLVQELPLCHVETFLTRQVAVAAYHLHDPLSLPAHPSSRVWISDHGHVFLRLLLRCLLLRFAAFLGCGLRSVDFVLEDVVLNSPVHVSLEELGSFLRVVQLGGEGVLATPRCRVF